METPGFRYSGLNTAGQRGRRTFGTDIYLLTLRIP